jgi:hypothetical protein
MHGWCHCWSTRSSSSPRPPICGSRSPARPRSVDGWAQRTIIWSPKLLLALAASGSFALNIAHAEPTWAARGVAAIPPIALVLTFEILLAVVRRAAAARIARLNAHQDGGASQQPPIAATATTLAPAAPAATDGPSTRNSSRSERPASTSRVNAPGARRGHNPAAARVAEVRRLYLEGVTVAEEIARRLELPPSTARRLLTKVKGELAARPTDDGAGERTSTVGERPVDERPPPPDGERSAGARPLPREGERHPVDGERSPVRDGDGERPAEDERDRQPPERALVLTREGAAER